MNSYNYYFFDLSITNLSTILVTPVSDPLATLYAGIINVTAVNTLILSKSVKFITDFTSIIISGTGINGSCTGICYLQLISSASIVVVVANTISYPVIISGWLSFVVLNPTFTLV